MIVVLVLPVSKVAAAVWMRSSLWLQLIAPASCHSRLSLIEMPALFMIRSQAGLITIDGSEHRVRLLFGTAEATELRPQEAMNPSARASLVAFM